MDWSGPWWLLILGLGFGLLIGAVVYARRSRRSGLGSSAAQLGLRELNRTPPFSNEEKKGFNLFSRGYAGKWTNIFADNPEMPSALFFDFSYRFGLRFIASVTHSQSVAAFSARVTGLPDFQLTPATSLERVAPKLGLQALRFESRPEFGKRYWLRSTQEIAARALFTNTFIDRLASIDPQGRWYVEKSGQWLLVYRHGTLAPPDLRSFWQTSGMIGDLFLHPN